MTRSQGDGSTRKRTFVVAALGATLGLMFGLLVAELAVRGFARISVGTGQRIASRDPLGMVYAPYGVAGYRPVPGRTERFPNGTFVKYNRMGFRGPAVKVQKPTGTYRIVLLGGSTAAGFGANDNETIDAHLRRELAARFPEACVEVVNFAVGGYDSYQDYERLRVDGSRLSPDLVVIHSGINDVRNAKYADLSPPPDPRTLLWETALEQARRDGGKRPGLWPLAKHYLYVARLPGYVFEMTRQRQTLTVTRAANTHESALDYFETNVRRTIDIAAGMGAVVILSTPPSALSLRNNPTDPVEKSYWIRDAGTTEAYRKRLSARMDTIAAQEKNAGRNITHLSYDVPLEEFLDDAHLLGPGNKTVARGLAEVVAPYLGEALSRIAVADTRCRASDLPSRKR